MRIIIRSGRGLDTYLLFYTMSGSGYLKYREEEYALTKGTLAIIQCREYQYYRTDEELWEFYFVHFYGRSADNYYQMLKERSAVFLKISNPIRMLELFQELEHWGRRAV
ncbi:MAG: AraC family ligand binding domain-containing protein [Lachnospiraceae bacterium]|nr:AraC family ligand binding domain-containing protein [Lachnospiraceae bacterium]